MIAAEIVYAILNDLSGRSGLDIEEIVDDQEIFLELENTLIEIVDAKLRDGLEMFLNGEY